MINKETVKEFIESVIIAGVLAFFIITFVIQSFVVQGHSMDDTLHNGERLFVNKFIYNFQSPERGDIIVLEPKGDLGRKYIKRVIGLPGDKLEIVAGNLFINDHRVKEDYILETMYGNYGPYHVPKGHVFVMGDNRNHSSDSRMTSLVGYVPYDAISGQAFWVYWPLTNMRVINDVTYPKLSNK
ncbi:signal peptidase I [Halanaerocella petrolearia]